jgi:putative hemolysin
MSAGAWLTVAALGAGAAAIAAADGALLSVEPEPDGGAPRGVKSIRDRERAHRALSFARLVLLLGAGLAIGEAVEGDAATTWQVVRAGLPAALALVFLVEGGARAAGHAAGVAVLAPLAPLVRLVELLLALPLALVGRLDAWLQHLVPPPEADDESRETTAERFRQVVAAEAGEAGGEEALIAGVFSLGDTEVREVMVPRVDIVGIDSETPWADVLARVRSSEHARFPVFEETLDDITGVLYAKDLLSAAIVDEEPEEGWLSLVRAAPFIPTSKPIDELLRELKASRTHIAIVIDEFGGTAGLITIEDVLEEIVGEIQDEYDVEEPEIVQEAGARFWVAGRVPAHDLEELLGVELELDDVTTVGGVVYTLFGRVPRAGESLVHRGFRVVVERVRRRRIERVYFERLPGDDEESEGEEE